MVKQSATTKKKSTTAKSKATKKPVTKSTAAKTSSKKPTEPFRPMLMTVAISSLAAVTLFSFAMISIL